MKRTLKRKSGSVASGDMRSRYNFDYPKARPNRFAGRAIAQVEYQLYGNLKRSGNWWIACCPPLDLSTQGKTQEEAKRNLIEASELFLISCIERGTLEMAMKELGFVPLSDMKITRPPNAFPIHIRIPFGVSKSVE